MPSYDLVQSIFLMNQAVNAISGFAYTQPQLQGMLQVYLNGGTDVNGQPWPGFFASTYKDSLAGGDWSVVWGPAVYCETPDVASESDNVAFVAYSESQAAYVLAVGATNFDSIYDWVYEDGNVEYCHQAAWPLALPFQEVDNSPEYPTTPVISAATALGVSNILCNLFDPVTNDSLSTYLGSITGSCTLYVTGHSLGGALSPTLALYFQQNSTNWSSIRFLATAGATPGNTAFAQLFSQNKMAPVATGSSTYPYWNTVYANNRDMVPCAWNNLGNIEGDLDWSSMTYPSLWGAVTGSVPHDYENLGLTLAELIDTAEYYASGGNYGNLTHTPFTPTWGYYNWVINFGGYWQYPPAWVPLPSYTTSNPILTDDELEPLVLAAHTYQYPYFFGVVPVPRLPNKTIPPDFMRPAPGQARKKLLQAAARLSPLKSSQERTVELAGNLRAQTRRLSVG